MGQGALRTLVAQRSQLPFGGFRGHPVRVTDCAADGFEQRGVEQLGVQSRDPHVLPFDLLAQHTESVAGAVRSHVRGAGQPAQRLVVIRSGKHVGALEPLQLQAVLEQAQELIRRGEVGGVVASDVAAGPQCRQCVHRRGDVQRVVGPAVNQLEQLDGELDVAQPTGAEFDLPVANPRGNQRLDPAAHRLHVGDEILTLAGGPDHRHQRVHVLPAQFGVPDGRPGLQQRLELPGLGPLLVVGDMGIQGSHQRPGLALRAQCGVDFEKRLGAQSHHLAGHPGGDRVGILAHEDHVDIADVVEFTGAALAHRDDCQPRCRGVPGAHRGDRDIECGRQGGVSEIGQMRADRGERQHRLVLHGRRQVESGQDHQLIAVDGTQPWRDSGWGRTVLGDAGCERRPQVRWARQIQPPFEQPPRVRIGGQVITECQRGAQHREQPAAQGAVLEQRCVELVPVLAEGLGDPDHGAQSGIGIGRPRQ